MIFPNPFPFTAVLNKDRCDRMILNVRWRVWALQKGPQTLVSGESHSWWIPMQLEIALQSTLQMVD